jgi:hypothetical protein
VDLGWILLDETNSEWKAKSKVVLGCKLKNTNKEPDERLTWLREAPGGLRRGRPTGLGRPAWADRPGPTATPPDSDFLQRIHACFVALRPRAPRGCTPKCSRPLIYLHYWSFHLMVLL